TATSSSSSPLTTAARATCAGSSTPTTSRATSGSSTARSTAARRASTCSSSTRTSPSTAPSTRRWRRARWPTRGTRGPAAAPPSPRTGEAAEGPAPGSAAEARLVQQVEGALDHAAQPHVLGGAALVEDRRLAAPDPAPLVVLARLEDGRVEGAPDGHDDVDLAPEHAARLPVDQLDDGAQRRELPARLLPELAPQRAQGVLARLGVAPDHVPGPGE